MGGKWTELPVTLNCITGHLTLAVLGIVPTLSPFRALLVQNWQLTIVSGNLAKAPPIATTSPELALAGEMNLYRIWEEKRREEKRIEDKIR